MRETDILHVDAAREGSSSITLFYPDEVDEEVTWYDEDLGGRIFWHYHESGHAAVLTRKSDPQSKIHNLILDNDEFEYEKESTVYSDDTRITFIQEVRKKLNWDVFDGQKIAYYAHKGMTSGERRSVYILNAKKLFNIMNNNEALEGTEIEFLLESP